MPRSAGAGRKRTDPVFGMAAPGSERQARKTLVECVKFVAEDLGNTPAVTRGSYICPVIFDRYQEGKVLDDYEPRAGRAEPDLEGLTRAEAALNGRDYVVPDDVRAVAHVVLAHRLLLDGPVRHDTTSPQARRIVDEVLAQVQAPFASRAEARAGR